MPTMPLLPSTINLRILLSLILSARAVKERRPSGELRWDRAQHRQRGKVTCYDRITREGSAWLRWAMVEAAIVHLSYDTPVTRFYHRVAERGVEVGVLWVYLYGSWGCVVMDLGTSQRALFLLHDRIYSNLFCSFLSSN